MARVFKPRYPRTRTVKGPDGKPVMIERVAKRGKNAGRKIMAVLREPVLDRNGEPVLMSYRKWYVEYRTANGTVRRVSGYPDKKATEQLALIERPPSSVKASLTSTRSIARNLCLGTWTIRKSTCGTPIPPQSTSRPSSPVSEKCWPDVTRFTGLTCHHRPCKDSSPNFATRA